MAPYQTGSTSQRLNVNWDDPSAWLGGVVPNALDADVTLAGIPTVRVAEPIVVTIRPGESFAVRSISNTGGSVTVDGSLAVTGAMTAYTTLSGGTLNTNGFKGVLAGTGTVTVAGAVSVPSVSGYSDSSSPLPGYVESLGGALSLTAASLDNQGMLYANGAPLTVTVTGGPGAFSQLSGNTLLLSGGPLLDSGTGYFTGTYKAANGGTLSVNAGGTIVNDGALIILGSRDIFGNNNEAAGSAADVIQSYDAAAGLYQPLQDTLQVVTGELDIDGGQSFAAINPLTIGGAVHLANGGALFAPSLTVLASGGLSGAGTVNGPLTDNGAVAASGVLRLFGAVGGSGPLFVGMGGASVLELGGAASNSVVFQDSSGRLQLDNPASFTGTIVVQASRTTSAATTIPPISDDQVILAGVALGSVTGTSYAGDANGGTLTIQEGAAQQSLYFAGNLSAGSFALSGGSDLDITVTPLPYAPTVSLQSGSRTVSGFITNTNALTVAGYATAGSALSVNVGGVTATPSVSAPYNFAGEAYTASVSPSLVAGLQQVAATVIATNAAGSAQTMAALNVDLLPAPINGVTTADVSSFDLKTLLNGGYAFSLAAGTQAVQLTNGTLSIGLGTTEALVEELYFGLLNRRGDSAGLGNYVSQINHGTSVATVAQGMIGSAEARQYAALATEPANTFVVQMYHSFLNRNPGAVELASYVSAINGGVTRGQVAATFATSGEAAQFDAAVPGRYSDVWSLDPQGALTTQLYETALGRDPELSAVAAWQDQLLAGLSPQAMAQIIASSFEFQADHNGQSAGGLVTSLYQAGLGRTPGASEVQGWVSQIQAGATPAMVTYGIATSAEAAVRLFAVDLSRRRTVIVRCPRPCLTVGRLAWISAPHPAGPVAEW